MGQIIKSFCSRGKSTTSKTNNIDKTVNLISVDSKDNLLPVNQRFGIYLLKNGETTSK
ncbi:hypothetical protein [Spiroplasma poulsonii]|uniref:hypothetical protein n=1 Tax=Spiroplasma poulsonii TaxID=2138 RepID=UPI001F4C640E|nr:hypothetical protein [Spiroplasma poulsonii]UNF62705.1 hypothetical protein MNU24_08235 [Spiroplasma poulsonii]